MMRASYFAPPSTWMTPKGRDTAFETYIRKLVTTSRLQKEQPLRTSDNEMILLLSLQIKGSEWSCLADKIILIKPTANSMTRDIANNLLRTQHHNTHRRSQIHVVSVYARAD